MNRAVTKTPIRATGSNGRYGAGRSDVASVRRDSTGGGGDEDGNGSAPAGGEASDGDGDHGEINRTLDRIVDAAAGDARLAIGILRTAANTSDREVTKAFDSLNDQTIHEQ